eukprot:m.1273457 g.1273457  ORF g.1273457 m.1273457 type:complete len:448 (-) comp24754_c0_seq6:4635-5978(-)
MVDLAPLTRKSFEPVRKSVKLPTKLKPPIEVEKKVLSPYLRYSKEIWSEYKKYKNDPSSTSLFSDKEYLGEGFSARDMSKYIAEKWNEMTPKQRDPYTKAYDRELKVYQKLRAEWKNSKEYLEWEKKNSEAIKLQKKYDKEYMIASAKYEIECQNGSIDEKIAARNTAIMEAKKQQSGASAGSGSAAGGTTAGAAPLYNIGEVPSEGRELVLHCAKVEASRQVGEVGTLQSSDQQKYAHYKVARGRYLRNNSFMAEIFCRTAHETAAQDHELSTIDPKSSKQNDALCQLLEDSIAHLSAANTTAAAEFETKVASLKHRSRCFEQCIKYRHRTSQTSPHARRSHKVSSDASGYNLPKLLSRIRACSATADTRVHKISAEVADEDEATLRANKRSRTELSEALHSIMSCDLPQQPATVIHQLQPKPKVTVEAPALGIGLSAESTAAVGK